MARWAAEPAVLQHGTPTAHDQHAAVTPMPAAGAASSRVRRPPEWDMPSCRDDRDSTSVLVSEMRDGRSVSIPFGRVLHA